MDDRNPTDESIDDARRGEASPVSAPSDGSPAADTSESPPADDTDEADPELPADLVDDAERLTRLARHATDENERTAYVDRRTRALAEYGFTARVREDSGDATLVLHPEEWHDEDEGVIRTDRIHDISRAIEIPLDGTGDPDDWDTVEEHNRTLVREVETAHGAVHGANASALADFLSNHYAKPIESATASELTEFRSEYFVRNAWPSKKQRKLIDDSIRLVYETASEPVPGFQVQ